jgi:hypothetical protein
MLNGPNNAHVHKSLSGIVVVHRIIVREVLGWILSCFNFFMCYFSFYLEKPNSLASIFFFCYFSFYVEKPNSNKKVE